MLVHTDVPLVPVDGSTVEQWPSRVIQPGMMFSIVFSTCAASCLQLLSDVRLLLLLFLYITPLTYSGLLGYRGSGGWTAVSTQIDVLLLALKYVVTCFPAGWHKVPLLYDSSYIPRLHCEEYKGLLTAGTVSLETKFCCKQRFYMLPEALLKRQGRLPCVYQEYMLH